MKYEINPPDDSPGTLWYMDFLRDRTTLFEKIASDNPVESRVSSKIDISMEDIDKISPGLISFIKLLIRAGSS